MARKKTEILFPLGIATGKAFCNRVVEREHLARNIQEGHHTLLIASRRYGKTSLVLQVREDMGAAKTPVVWEGADFLIASDEQSVQKTILDCVGRIIAAILPVHKNALNKISKVISSLSPKLTLSGDGAKIELSPGPNPQETIVEALMGLDKIAGDEGVRAVLMMDEFQQIGTLRQPQTLEAAIRHAVERAKNTSYVFSGSNRHMLTNIFDDKARPLYHLCDRLPLMRIEAKDYLPFLKAAARRQWEVSLDEAVLTAILAVTQRHPYYVNVLCSRLWKNAEPPDLSLTEATWNDYVKEERNRIVREIGPLSPNQRAVLAAIAANPTDQITSKTFLNQTRLAGTSAVQAVQALIERDLFYQDQDSVYRLLDPAIEHFLLSML